MTAWTQSGASCQILRALRRSLPRPVLSRLVLSLSGGYVCCACGDLCAWAIRERVPSRRRKALWSRKNLRWYEGKSASKGCPSISDCGGAMEGRGWGFWTPVVKDEMKDSFARCAGLGGFWWAHSTGLRLWLLSCARVAGLGGFWWAYSTGLRLWPPSFARYAGWCTFCVCSPQAYAWGYPLSPAMRARPRLAFAA